MLLLSASLGFFLLSPLSYADVAADFCSDPVGYAVCDKGRRQAMLVRHTDRKPANLSERAIREKWTAIVAPHRERLNELFAQARAGIIRHLKQKLRKTWDRDHQALLRQMIQRVESVQLSFDTPTSGFSADPIWAAKEDFINAQYSRQEHRLQLSYGLIARIDAINPATYVEIFGHEIGHAIDSCQIFHATMDKSLAVSRIRRSKVEKLTEPLVKCFQRNGVRLSNVFEHHTYQVNFCSEYPATECEAFSRACICKEGGAYEKNQLQEAMADYYGALALEHYFRALPKGEALESAIAMVQDRNGGISCPPTYENPADDPHPGKNLRIRNVMFANPGLRQAIGCPAKKIAEVEDCSW